MRTPPLHHLPPLEAVVSQHISPAGGLINGDVQMDPTAQIGPGVLLQADPGCQIRVGAGACIGMGSIIHAPRGIPDHRPGGDARGGGFGGGSGYDWGQCLCRLLFHHHGLLCGTADDHPPGSLMGDESREAAMTGIPEAGVDKPSVAPSIPVGPGQLSSLEPPGTHRLPNNPNANVQESLAAWHQAQSQSSPSPQPAPPKTVKPNGIPGQADLDRLLNRIVPHRLGNTAE
ncbi:MAG: hypothetical protein HC818_06545 [Synechococcaceae cyanobacterium RM1_1_27]|nr:hypothetical protein [Synechococcaceae cyanobacterium RM1_1_27]